MKKILSWLPIVAITITAGCTVEQVNTLTGTVARLPEEKTVAVPFSAQAPEGNWAEPWQNACEEASIIMIDNFYKGDAISKEQAKKEILSIFTVKEATEGVSEDESMATIARIIDSAKLSWTAYVVENPSIEDLKKELTTGRPIIMPIDARQVDNPNYTDVDYHVIVVKGYDNITQEFITNDPGTSRGEDFRYMYNDLYSAIHDFTKGANSAGGPKRVLFTRVR